MSMMRSLSGYPILVVEPVTGRRARIVKHDQLATTKLLLDVGATAPLRAVDTRVAWAVPHDYVHLGKN